MANLRRTFYQTSCIFQNHDGKNANEFLEKVEEQQNAQFLYGLLELSEEKISYVTGQSPGRKHGPNSRGKTSRYMNTR
jgi:hypothetical protein